MEWKSLGAGDRRGPSMLLKKLSMTKIKGKVDALLRLEQRESGAPGNPTTHHPHPPPSQVDTLLDTLRTELNCNSVVLLPVTNENSAHGSKKAQPTSPSVALIPLLPLARAVATDVAGGGATEHKAEAKVEDESLEKGTPAGLCISSRKPVRVDNALADRRFKYKRASGLSGLSQLCVPVFGSEV